MSTRSRQFFVPRSVYVPVLAICAIVTTIVLGTLVWLDLRDAEQAFLRRASSYHDQLSQRLSDHEAVLGGLAALHHAMEDVDYDQLALYSREMLESFPHIDAIEYLVRIPHRERRAFEAHMQQDGFAGFHIRERAAENNSRRWVVAGERPSYFPILFVEPFEPAYVQALGFDAYSDPALREAIVGAMESGRVHASAPTRLVTGERGYLVFKAVYKGRRPPLEARARREATAQVVAVVVEPASLAAGLTSLEPGTRVRLYHAGGSPEGAGELLYEEGEPRKSGWQLMPTFRYHTVSENRVVPFSLVIERIPPFAVVRLHLLIGALSGCLLITALILQVFNVRFSSAAVRKKAREEIYRERERAEVTLDSIADGVVTTDVYGIVEYLNPVAERLTGWRSRDARGKRINDVLHLVDEVSGNRIRNPVERCIKQGITIKLGDDVSLIGRSGRRYAINESVAPIRDVDGATIGTVMVFQDIGKAREMSQLLAYQAMHDDLTNLLNRREFGKRVERAIETAQDSPRRYVLCYMDLDRFKVVNDTCGHLAGDQLLREVASLMEPHFREQDTLARLGGDEFGILLEECELAEAIALAEELIEKIKKHRFLWEEKAFDIGASMGIVPIAREYSSLAQALSFADSACYLAKELGGDRVHVYQADDDALIKRQGEMEWVHRITHAYSENRFVLYAQEIVPLRDHGGGARHYEVLLRMVDEFGALVLPTEYISAAERYNMMFDLDRWVLRNAFELINKYVQLRKEHSDLPVKVFSINLSGQSLGDDRGPDYVKRLFGEFPELPEYIVFEITETAAVSNMAQANRFIAELRELGCSFSLDDFGTGVSSFAYLRDLSVQYLKIDGSFVKDISFDPVNYAMVGSINQIGHVMEIKTIAEYVEDKGIRENLAELGVDFGQGNWLSRPQRLVEVVSAEPAGEAVLSDELSPPR